MAVCPSCRAEVDEASVLLGEDGVPLCGGCGSRLSMTEPPPPPGVTPPPGPVKRIGPFEIVFEIARGGMGIVYKGRDPDLDRFVALKVMIAGEHASEEMIERFQREAKTAANLRHPGIVQVHAVGRYGGLRYIAMEYVDGEALDQIRRKDPATIVAHIRDAARALAHAHRHGIVHRDIKPANIMVTSEGAIKITDFGLARLVEDSQLTQSGQVMGTPTYMSPEQAMGDARAIGPLSDLFSLGVTLYALLAGRPPFHGPTPVATILKVCNEDPEPPSRVNPGIPPALEAVILKAIRKPTAERYQSGDEFADDLDRFLRDEPVLARPERFTRRMVRRIRRNPWPVAALLSILVAAAAVGVFLVAPLPEPPPGVEPTPERRWLETFQAAKGDLAFHSFKSDRLAWAGTLLDQIPEPLAGDAAAWFEEQRALLPAVPPKDEWLAAQPIARRASDWCEEIAELLNGRGEALDRAAKAVAEAGRAYAPVLGYRGKMGLVVLAHPFANVRAVHVDGRPVVEEGTLVGDAAVSDPELTTPLRIEGLDIGNLSIELVHPKLGSHRVSLAADGVAHGDERTLSGVMGRPESFKLR